MQENEVLSPQDAVESSGRLRKIRIGFQLTSETDAERWEEDGRGDDRQRTTLGERSPKQ